jgi:hypothetical protein
MAQAVNGRPVNLDIPARSPGSADWIYGELISSAIGLSFEHCSFALPVSFRQSSILFLILKLPLSEGRACCILREDDSDRMYLRCCSIRAWTRLRCNFHRLRIIVFNSKQWLHKRKETKYTPMLPPDSPRGFGTPCPGYC